MPDLLKSLLQETSRSGHVNSHFVKNLAPCGLALLPVATLPMSLFLHTVCSCSPVDHPDVMLLQARFDLAHYDNTLFATYNLPFPDHLNNAVAKRRAEYLASRVCVRYALGQLGIDHFILTNDKDRAPLWPQGIVGSLSHTHHCISLLLARATSHKLPGVDCEKVMKHQTAEEMQSMIITPQEMTVLQQSGLPFAAALTVAFSLKESLYKAMFPQLRTFMNFDSAEIISCTPNAGRVGLRLTRTFSDAFPAGREFTGRALLEQDDVLSWVIAPST